MAKLDKGHCKEITDVEKRVIACWMDLGVPFCGDYTEGAAWNASEIELWKRYTVKKDLLATAREKIED